MNSQFQQKQYKRFFVSVGTIGVIFIVVIILWYRGQIIGAAGTTGLFQKDIDALNEKESFVTAVTYSRPFMEGAVEPNPEQDNYLARAVESLKRLAFWNGEIDYRAVVPTFTTIQSEDDDYTIFASPETVVDTSPDRRSLGYTGQRKLLVDKEGSVSIAYRKRWGDDYQIFLSELQHMDNGYVLSTPSQPLSVRTIGITQRVPAIALDEKGSTHIVWYGSDKEEFPNRRQILHSQTKNSKNFWEENDMVSYVEGYSSDNEYWQEHPSITLGNFDDLFVVWEGKDKDHDKQQVKFSRSLDGGGDWSEWKNIHPSTNFTFSRPTLVYTSDGTLHLFAYSSEGVRNGTTQIQYSYSQNLGGSWSDWKVVSKGDFDARHISATAVNDRPIISYRTQLEEDGPTQIVAQQVHFNDVSDPQPIFASENYQFFPSITAVEGTEQFCVTWIEENTASGFPNEDVTDGDIYFGCRAATSPQGDVAFNLTPTGSHLYPVLPQTVSPDLIPIAYYDDDAQEIMLRLLKLPSPDSS